MPPDAPDADILVVDDDAATRDVLGRMLRSKAGASARPRTGDECVAALEELSPPSILLDLMMPGMDGFEVLEALRTGARGAIFR